MVPQVELFSFVVWKNWRHQKDISTLTDLWRYQKYHNGAIFFRMSFDFLYVTVFSRFVMPLYDCGNFCFELNCEIISRNNINTKSNNIKKNLYGTNAMHIAQSPIRNEIKSLSWVAIKNWHSIKNTKVYKNFGRIWIEDDSYLDIRFSI